MAVVRLPPNRPAAPRSVFDVLGSSQASRAFWSSLGDPIAADAATHGVRISFSSPPPVSVAPACSTSRVPEKRLEISRQVDLLVEQGMVSRIPLDSVGFWGHVFLTPKPDGSWRLILDLSRLNQHVELPRFQLLQLKEVLPMIRPGDWMASIDLEKAYWHVPMAPEARRFLQFRIDDCGYCFNVLPFGLSSAPFWFTRILKPLVASLSADGIKLAVYLDDFFLCASRDLIEGHVARTVSVLSQAGFKISDSKSVLSPVRSLTYLGVVISSDPLSTAVPSNKQVEMASMLLPLISAPSVSRRQLEVVSGFINYFVDHSLFLRPLHWQLVHLMNLLTSSTSRDLQVPVPASLRALLERLHAFRLFPPVPFHDPLVWEEIMVDSSGSGWGAWWSGWALSGMWAPEWAACSINVLETRAILLALTSWGPRLQDRGVMLHTDSITAASVVRRRGSPRSLLLCSLAEDLDGICMRWRILLRAAHVAGERNVIADRLSRRRPQASEWSLDPGVFRRICREFGVPEVDLCATADNAQTPVFVSPLPTDPLQDCLSIPWDEWSLLYAFPPTRLLPRFLHKVERLSRRQSLILVYPEWRSRSWYGTLEPLLAAADRPPIPLRLGPQGLRQEVLGRWVYHPNPGMLNLHAARLSGTC